MLEESSDDAHHANVVAHTRNTGTQTANSANYEIDLHARLRRLVQRLDDLCIDDGIHLCDDARALSLDSVTSFAVEQREETPPHVRRRDDQLSIQPLARETRKRVEQIAQVGAQRRTAREQSDVRVDTRSLRIVVAGADMRVPANAVAFLPHHESCFCVSLQSRESIRDVHTEVLE